jgi:hypothetical protein
MHVDLLSSADGTVHAINSQKVDNCLQVGILCLMSCRESTIRIADDYCSFVVDIPAELRSSHERVKAFNVELTILDHEQIQLPA